RPARGSPAAEHARHLPARPAAAEERLARRPADPARSRPSRGLRAGARPARRRARGGRSRDRPPGGAGVSKGTIGGVPERLYFTDSDEANALIASDPMALLIGFALDQQVPVQKAFSGPLVLCERLGSIDPETLASADLEPVFRTKPAIHRFPGAMATRVH